ncbi:MAG: hypothetical protein K2Z25_23085 [Beijerinckiaceae bacterium]|nr:hypothetical protein [Beijerinckiaceae bacterium]
MNTSTKENLLAVDLELIARLKKAGSWCGETHVQKSMFLLSTFADSKLGYDFIIYKHGPFSFDFKDDLVILQSIGAVKLKSTVAGYGPSFEMHPMADAIRERSRDFIKKYTKAIDYVADKFGKNDVKYLEKITTAIFITQASPKDSDLDRAKKMYELKPHIPLKECELAMRTAQIYTDEMKKIKIS